MTNMLKKYGEHQKKVTPKSKSLPSGVACDELKCSGEMMVEQPEVTHPELPLKRASCGKCRWKGWV